MMRSLPGLKSGRACGPGVNSADALLFPLRLRFFFLSLPSSLLPLFSFTL
ncbi:hypothetical protein IBT47_26640 [Erwinia sp. S43]|nr:hypothetical protein [Erwinia sp. S43]MBK0035852.1 hypothetical protein [Erwinia sp. S43]